MLKKEGISLAHLNVLRVVRPSARVYMMQRSGTRLTVETGQESRAAWYARTCSRDHSNSAGRGESWNIAAYVMCSHTNCISVTVGATDLRFVPTLTPRSPASFRLNIMRLPRIHRSDGLPRAFNMLERRALLNSTNCRMLNSEHTIALY